MAWQHRLRPAEIITPDGKQYDFQYEDVSITIDNKTSRYTFGNQAGALVQNFGLGITSLPLTIYFTGNDYDTIADDFMKSAALPGNSILGHPIYGDRSVVIESIQRNDRLKSEANQAVIQLTITETISDEILLGVIEISSIIADKIDKLALLNGIVSKIANYKFTLPASLANAIARIQATIDIYRQAFKAIIATSENIRTQFESVATAIESNLDTLIGEPIQLFAAISRLVEFPARAAARIGTKLDGYKNLIRLFTNSIINDTTQDATNQRIEVQAHLSALMGGLASANIYAASNSAGSAQITNTSTQIIAPINEEVITTINTGIGFVTRNEAIQAGISLIEQLQQIQLFLDIQQELSVNSLLDTRFIVAPELTNELSEIIKGTVASLIALSFQLRQERIITLQKNITFIELCYSLYGTTNNNTLDFFIYTNKLIDEEFIMIPKGREIKYYV